MSGLFRPEALQAQQQQWLGSVQIVRPPALSWLTGAAVLLVVAVLAFATLASYTRKAQVAGVLVPDLGLLRVVPATAGTVRLRHVVEGQAVRAGDPMFEIERDNALRDDSAQAAVRRSVEQQRLSLEASAQQQRDLAATRDTALARRLLALADSRRQLADEAALHQRRLALAQRGQQRLQDLQAQAYVSEAQVQARAEEVLALQAQAQTLARQASTLAREQAELEGERQALPLQTRAALAQTEAALAELTRDGAEWQAVRRVVLRAPQDGTVAHVLAEPGQAVSPASALASLVPAGATLQAQLYAPSRAIGFVQPGQAVRLRLEAYPYAKYGALDGQVLRLSPAPLAASELADLNLPAGTGSTEPMFRITVALAPTATFSRASALPLAAGMRLQADVLLERRRLVEWLFEPLLRLRERL